MNIIFEAYDELINQGTVDNGLKKAEPSSESLPILPALPVVDVGGDVFDLNGKVELRKYGSRTFSVWLNGQLLAVTVYKKGAMAIKTVIERLQNLAMDLKMKTNRHAA